MLVRNMGERPDLGENRKSDQGWSRVSKDRLFTEAKIERGSEF